MRRLFLIFLISTTVGCARESGLFIGSNAQAHIAMLAGTIGNRPVGTPANARAREYVVDQLKQMGFDVRVQEVDARRHELGRTVRVANIIAVLPGERTEALGLVSHYDSSPDAPGATDDALGVGVSLEAARVLAASSRRRWTLMVLVTDGEESGLMGAAALVTDREVMDRLRAYINLESIGSSGTSVLFETGPGNAWLVTPWARKAPHPRGSSYALEVYQRLPNDTDFTILKTRDIPGLNFAPVGDSYAYHTARDTPERLSPDTVRTTGENVVTILTALQEIDITQRSRQDATYFDVAESVGISYRPFLGWIVSTVAVLLGIFAWVRLTADAVRENGLARWLLTLVWAWLGAAVVCASMVAATSLLRTAREVYHPWYARPGRLFALLLFVGCTFGWSTARLGQWLPRRAHPARHPALVWTIALPAWIVLAALALWFAPSAAYLWTVPLFVGGVVLSVSPPRNDALIRIGSLVILAVAATMWLREAHVLLRFVVAVMGRLPIVTPVFVYAALMCVAGLMIVPPLVAVVSSPRPLARPWLLTTGLLLGTAIMTGAVYLAPAYTREQPLRRHARALQDGDAANAIWEIGSVEPGLDLTPDAPPGWMPVDAVASGISVPWGRYAFPFVFRTSGPPLGQAPAAIAAFTVTPLPGGVQLRLAVVPREPALTLSFVLPSGITPARSSLPGVMRLGRWTATYVAPPAEGIAWEASFSESTAEQLRDTRVAVTSSGFPGGAGWQRLPSWLPQETAVWSATSTWIVPATSAPPIAPVPPLR